MAGEMFCFDESGLRTACERYVADGPAPTRALRQQEADGTLALLLSDAAVKLRVRRADRAADPVVK